MAPYLLLATRHWLCRNPDEIRCWAKQFAAMLMDRATWLPPCMGQSPLSVLRHIRCRWLWLAAGCCPCCESDRLAIRVTVPHCTVTAGTWSLDRGVMPKCRCKLCQKEKIWQHAAAHAMQPAGGRISKGQLFSCRIWQHVVWRSTYQNTRQGRYHHNQFL
jgi:hypothetical protein